MKIKVSNSEALSVGSCETKWMYAFHPAFNIEPKYQSIALVRGNIGHGALEAFFNKHLERQSFEECTEAARGFLVSEIVRASTEEDTNALQATTELMPIIDEYLRSPILHKFLDEVDILGVESGIEVQLDNGLILPGRVDLLVKYKKGPYKGETVPVDHKFVYNFWSADDFRMNSQIPSYIHALKSQYPDAFIRRGVVNQLRWRNNAQDRFTMTPITPPKQEVKAVIANHLRLSERILAFRALDGATVQGVASMTLSKYSCGNCGFKQLCKSELTGGNTKDLMIMDYRPNSYGYGGDEET